MAFLWFYCSNKRMKDHHRKEGNLVRKYYEPPESQGSLSARTKHIVVRKSMPPPFKTRETSTKQIWANNGRDRGALGADLVFAFEPPSPEFCYHDEDEDEDEKQKRHALRKMATKLTFGLMDTKTSENITKR